MAQCALVIDERKSRAQARLRALIKMTTKHERINIGEPSLETRRSPLIRGVAPQMRDQAAYLTLGGGAGGRSLGSIFCITRIAALYLPPHVVA